MGNCMAQQPAVGLNRKHPIHPQWFELPWFPGWWQNGDGGDHLQLGVTYEGCMQIMKETFHEGAMKYMSRPNDLAWVTKAYGDVDDGGNGMNRTGYDLGWFIRVWYVPRPASKARTQASVPQHERNVARVYT